jgi:hypothetical protein
VALALKLSIHASVGVPLVTPGCGERQMRDERHVVRGQQIAPIGDPAGVCV